MSFFGKLGKMVMDVVETPIAVIKDVATMGGVLTDRDETYTAEKLGDIQDDWDDMKDELE